MLQDTTSDTLTDMCALHQRSKNKASALQWYEIFDPQIHHTGGHPVKLKVSDYAKAELRVNHTLRIRINPTDMRLKLTGLLTISSAAFFTSVRFHLHQAETGSENI